MPLKLLRGEKSVKGPLPPLKAGDEAGLTEAYLRLFEREAGWPRRGAETGLLGLDAGFTPERSLRVAVRAASIYLRAHEADITIRVPEGRLDTDFSLELAQYIARRYTGGPGLFGQSFSRTPPAFNAVREEAKMPDASAPDASAPDASAPNAPAPEAAPRPLGAAGVFAAAPARKVRLEDMLKKTDAGFSETLLRLIDESGRKDAEVYKAANIDRKLFSKIRSNPAYRPSKATALALAFALRLDLPQTRDLIGRAGYSLTHASVMDIIVEYYIENKNYDIFALNETLFRYDQPLLGGA